MDKLEIKKRLYGGLGDYARMRRGQALKKKYATGMPEFDRAQEGLDDAAEGAEMPKMGKAAGMNLAAPFTKGIDEVAADAGKGNEAYARALDEASHDMDEDEEMQKWMAKQRG